VSAGAGVWVAIAAPPGQLLPLGELVTDLDAPAREPCEVYDRMRVIDDG